MKEGLPPELLEMFRKEEKERVAKEHERLNRPTTAELKHRKQRKRKNKISEMSKKRNRK